MPHFTKEEIEAISGVIGLAWFAAVTAGQYISVGRPDFEGALKMAEIVEGCCVTRLQKLCEK
jgi:hypothetical protein